MRNLQGERDSFIGGSVCGDEYRLRVEDRHLLQVEERIAYVFQISKHRTAMGEPVNFINSKKKVIMKV